MSSKEVYQFKVILKAAPLPIWRRIQVPSVYSFWDFHVAIQDAMGWLGCHFHDFEVINPKTNMKERIGIPDPELNDLDTLSGRKVKICNYFNNQNVTAHYTYDFGDDWQHLIEFEGKSEKLSEQEYPVCIKGKNACPPEDVGGVWGYDDFLKIIEDPEHEEHEDFIEWIGGEFDPKVFNSEDVKFGDPEEHWNMVSSLR